MGFNSGFKGLNPSDEEYRIFSEYDNLL